MREPLSLSCLTWVFPLGLDVCQHVFKPKGGLPVGRPRRTFCQPAAGWHAGLKLISPWGQATLSVEAAAVFRIDMRCPKAEQRIPSLDVEVFFLSLCSRAECRVSSAGVRRWSQEFSCALDFLELVDIDERRLRSPVYDPAQALEACMAQPAQTWPWLGAAHEVHVVCLL